MNSYGVIGDPMPPPFDGAMISGLREQILANAVVLFPVISDRFINSTRFQNHGWVPTSAAFDVITIQATSPGNPEGQRTGYKAVLVYKTLPVKEDPKIAAVGPYAASVARALQGLLDDMMAGMRGFESSVRRFEEERPGSRAGRYVMDVALVRRTIALD
nr:hypothetical protein CFP56_48809 [Quercus suber]